MKTQTLHTFWVLVLLCLAAFPAFPQADVATATLKGTVTDESNAVIPGAGVTVKDLDRGIVREATTDALGVYQVRLLPPGAYEVRISAAGFITRVMTRVELTVGQIAVYDAHLRVGAVSQEVIVNAEAQLVETERTQQANTIQQSQIASLPNIARNFFSYVYTLPGVASSNAPRAQGNGNFNFGSTGFSIGGSNGRANLITIDGGENEFGDGEPRFFVSPESVQEFQVNRNGFTAEYGFTSGTAVNVVSKGGSNQYHGSVYAYYRSQHTSARNYFDSSATKAFDQQFYPGANVGGPLVKNKLFFFASYEQQRLNTATFRHFLDNPALVNPDAGQVAFLGRLNASGNSNLQRIAGSLQTLLTATKVPNTFNLLRRDDGAFTVGTFLHQLPVKMDYQISNNDVLSGRFTFFRNDGASPSCTDPGTSRCISNSTVLRARDYTSVINWTHNFKPNVINQARVQFAPGTSARTTAVDPTGSELIIGGVGVFGRSFTAPFNTFEKRYQFEDTLSWVKGKHFVKFGGSYRPVRYHVINALWFGGQWTFQGSTFPLTSALPAADAAAVVAFNGGTAAGIPFLNGLQSFSAGLPLFYRQGFNNPEWSDWAKFLGLFLQDSWKVTPRFTLDYGVRFDNDVEPRPLSTYNHASPRVGFAWDPFGDQKTVFRGGAGIFHAPVGYQIGYLTNILNDSGAYINQIFHTAGEGALGSVVAWGAGLRNGVLPFKGLSAADFAAINVPTGPKGNGRVVFEAAKQYQNTYSVQANFGVTRQLVRDLALDLAYNYYRGVHIQLDQEINYKQTGQTRVGVGPLLTRIDPTITQFNNYSGIGNSAYNGLTVSLTKHYSAYSQFQVNYTFSHSIDDVTDYNSAFSAHDPTNLRLERGTSAFNVTHNFVANAVLSSPFKSGSGHNPLSRAFADITLSPVVFLRSGIPFTLLLGGDFNGDTHAGDRPIYAARNTGLGGNFYSWDMRLSKQFYANRDKGLRVEFIVEAINILNHTNFQSVNNLAAGNNVKFLTPPFAAGIFNVTGDRSLPASSPLGFNRAFDPRRIQFGLKIAF